MSYRAYNFNPGPATLPLTVLQEIQEELLDYRGMGLSVMEMSHRSHEFEEIIGSAEALMLELLGLPTTYQVLFLQGGASLQFAMLPLNFLPPGATADYINTGSFASKALEEAKKLGDIHVAASTKNDNFRSIPGQHDLKLSNAPAYIHITTNNTIYGTQWKYIPDCGETPLTADMSSDILSRKLDMTKFSLAYAGAQKNLGPAGVTVVIIKKSFLENALDNIPTMISYKTYAKTRSLHNTPPTFSVYVLKLVLAWVKEKGGLAVIEEQNKKKAALIYDVIDTSEGFYRGHAAKKDRSDMNVTFRLPSESLEKAFADEAAQKGLIGLKGHRSVGGIRASLYNALPLEGAETLAEFMKDFMDGKR
ncbi:MAG: 3-phosphoserine/phosphohydroxythreonine transaminase [Firmicutes bacterium]|nr:3-phosphoserine/phosphohydroxythreonine transaminase [Bacillota bacterium]